MSTRGIGIGMALAGIGFALIGQPIMSAVYLAAAFVIWALRRDEE
jgi:hypothetical protein